MALLTFEEFLVEVAQKFVSAFPNKLGNVRTALDTYWAGRGIQAITRDRDYNKTVMKRGAANLPSDSSRTQGVKMGAVAMNMLFDKDKPSLAINDPIITYHGTRHIVKFDNDHMTMQIPTSTTPHLDKAISHSVRKREGETLPNEHHILAIHWDPKDNHNVPLVSIANMSSKPKEEELLLPPGTRFMHSHTVNTGNHPKTGSPVLIHHVIPIDTHPKFDRNNTQHDSSANFEWIKNNGGRPNSAIYQKALAKELKKQKAAKK